MFNLAVQLLALGSGLPPLICLPFQFIFWNMGSCPCACLSSLRETRLPPTRVVTLTVDPRWDVEGFNKWADSCKLGWLRVGYLRELHELRKAIPYRHLAPEGSLFVGAPPTDVSLYSLCPFTWLGEKFSSGWDPLPAAVHPDPDGFVLACAVQYLNKDSAFDDDLVFFFPPQHFCTGLATSTCCVIKGTNQRVHSS